MSKRFLWILVIPFVALCCAVPLWLAIPLLKGVKANVVRVAHADAALQAAAKEARDKLPEFEKRLSGAKEGERFAIKGKFTGPYGPEYLWVKDPVALVDGFSGVLDQEPTTITSLHKGDTVKVTAADTWDWLIRDVDGSKEGGFTDRALNSPVR